MQFIFTSRGTSGAAQERLINIIMHLTIIFRMKKTICTILILKYSQKLCS